MVYICTSRQSAEAGDSEGGTGFLCNYRMGPETVLTCVITNHHVVAHGGLFVRPNGVSGGSVVIEVPASEWVHGIGFDDVAAAEVPDGALDNVEALPLEWQEVAMEDNDVDELNIQMFVYLTKPLEGDQTS